MYIDPFHYLIFEDDVLLHESKHLYFKALDVRWELNPVRSHGMENRFITVGQIHAAVNIKGTDWSTE